MRVIMWLILHNFANIANPIPNNTRDDQNGTLYTCIQCTVFSREKKKKKNEERMKENYHFCNFNGLTRDREKCLEDYYSIQFGFVPVIFYHSSLTPSAFSVAFTMDLLSHFLLVVEVFFSVIEDFP